MVQKFIENFSSSWGLIFEKRRKLDDIYNFYSFEFFL